MLRAIRPNARRAQVSRGSSIPVPVGGWDAVSPLADMKEDRAPVLDNWFPHPNYLQVRRGYGVHATIDGVSSPVESLMVYTANTSAASKLFAASGTKIYDASSSGAVLSAGVSSLTNARWQHTNFVTSGGKFLWICNGADQPRHYNGSAWAVPAITGITDTDIINVNSHKNRLWFILKDSTQVAYLATGAVAGAATTFQLGGFLSKGGYIVAMTTLTRDGGAGPDDWAVFISSRGQVIAYQGTDPSSASTWSMVGVYDLGAPIGRRCFTRLGGDVALINIDGVLPLVQAMQTDRAAAATIALTQNINNAMNEAARDYSANFGWELISYPKGTMGVLNVPVTENATQVQFVINTLTGAWCRFTGWNFNTFAVFRENLYGGGNDGIIYRADNTSLDLNTQVDAVGQTAYNYLKSPGVLKHIKMVQPIVTADGSASPSIGVSVDFSGFAELSAPSSVSVEQAVYGVAVYGVDVYPVVGRITSNWTTVFGLGQSVSVHFRARTGADEGLSFWGTALWGSSEWSASVPGDVTLRLNAFNVIHERGGFF